VRSLYSSINHKAIKDYEYHIRWLNNLENPSEEIQLIAVKLNAGSIQYIKNPSEAVQLEAVKQNLGAIQYIKNPSEEVQFEAIKQDFGSIQYIKEPSESVIRFWCKNFIASEIFYRYQDPGHPGGAAHFDQRGHRFRMIHPHSQVSTCRFKASRERSDPGS
jgi:hypothetical protein